ncbi:MAG: glycosyltransferase family 4 protein [Chlorobiales bacterium]|nr:glycosyltransferase family 4 protein [Chlorobiales bacterium]
MKITYVSCLTQNCGIGRYTHELASRFYESGNEVELYRKEGGKESFIKSYPYRSFKSLKYYVAPYYLKRAISSLRSDIWHADYVDSATALYLAGKKSQKIVTTAHDAIPFIYSKPLDRFAYQYELKKAVEVSQAILVVSEKSKEDLIYYAGINPDMIHVVYNGINHQFFYPDPQKQPNEIFTICYIGGLAKHKNVEAIIHTAKILEKEGLKFQIQIGGGGAEHTNLPKLVRDLNLKSLTFSGFIPNERLRAFLSGADVFIYPSLYEGFGFPPLEAMACGTPTVSSNKGSLQEVLNGGAELTEPSPENFAVILSDLIKNPEKLHALREKAILTASRYTWSKTAQETERIYQKLR